MARPLASGKKSVDLATQGPRVSRIRRDPPPKVVEKQIDPKEIERRDVVIGVIVFTLAICVLIFALGNRPSGWMPEEYVLELNAAE
jgi:hypothetical protein